MGALTCGSIMFAIAVWIAIDRVRARQQNMKEAIDAVIKQLATTRRSNGIVLVEIWQCHPLSEQMIIAVAESKRFQFEREERNHNGSPALGFRPRKDITQGLSIDVD